MTEMTSASPLPVEEIERFVEELRRDTPGAFLRIPRRDLPADADPVQWAENCFLFDARDWTLRRGEDLDAAGLASACRDYAGGSSSFITAFETPGHILYLEPSVRQRLGAHVLRALADVMSAPMPLCVSLHLWRNRVWLPSFVLKAGPSLWRDLNQLAEDLVALSCCRELDVERVNRVLYLLRKPKQHTPLRVSEAAGPLPVDMTYTFAVKDGANFVARSLHAHR